jgi:putative peptidoglycan lipid II flippase
MSEKRSLLRTAGLVGSLTILSRVVGLLRDIVIASRLGANYVSDCFNIAFEIPNLARRVLGEGALSAFVVPIYAHLRAEKGEKASWLFVSNALNCLTLLSAVLTVLGMLFSKYLFILFGGAKFLYKGQTEFLLLGEHLTRIMFPFLMLLALASLLMGVLHSLKHFTAPALGSTMLNLAIVGSHFLFRGAAPERFVFVLAWAVLAGVLLRLLILFPPLLRRGFRYVVTINFRSAELKELVRLLLPAIYGLAVVHINISINLNFANWLGPGSVTYLRNANRLVQFPLGIFAASIATALLPSLSAKVIENKKAELEDLMLFTFRVLLIIFVPAAFGLIALGYPVIQLLLERGHWTPLATQQTYFALICYAVGLLPSAGLRILTPLYYARRDLMTPFRVGLLAMVLNVLLNVLFLFTPLRHAGLALATSLVTTLNFALLLKIMRKQFPGIVKSTLLPILIKAIIAGIIMAAGCKGLHAALVHFMPHRGFMLNAAIVLGCVGAGAGLFVLIGHLIGLHDIGRAVRIVLRIDKTGAAQKQENDISNSAR